MNRQFPPAVVKTTPMGKQAEFQDGILISAERKEFASEEEKKEVYEADQFQPDFDNEYLKVRVVLENVSEEEKSVPLTDISIEAAGFANGLSDVIVLSGDGQEDHFTQNLEPGEKRQIELWYGVISTMYSKKNWEKVKEDEFYLTYTLYPEKQRLALQ